jgi:bla regulator protein BlaR1
MMARLDSLLIAATANVALAVLLKATLTTTLALGAVRAAARSRAAVRHVLLVAAFGVLLVLPVAAALVPAMTIAVPVTLGAAPAVDITRSDVSETQAVMPVTDAPNASLRAAAAERSWPSASTLLAAVWALGALVTLVPVFIGLWQVVVLRRSGLPWLRGRGSVASLAPAGLARRVDVVLHEHVHGPMTWGAIRHTIVLPGDADDWPTEDLHRALVHELEHARRADWFSQCVARGVCAIYWFHPLVWAARRALALEAERACDDAVLERAEATGYADQLVGLARRLAADQHPPRLAMANRRDLSARIRALLDGRQARGPAGVWVVVCAGVGAAAVVAAMSPLQIIAAGAGALTTGPRFAAASIRPCGSGGAGFGDQTLSAGRITVACRDLVSFIEQAYQQFADGRVRPPWTAERFLISGGPDWVKQDRYTIEATADGATSAAVMLGPMTQSLLEDRFKLSLHHEVREVPVYELVATKEGARVGPPPAGTCVDRDALWADPTAAPTLPAGQHWCSAGWHLASGRIVWQNEGLDLDEFVLLLRGFADRPIVNATGIKGTVAFHLDYEPSNDLPATALSAALKQQLGLELRPSKASLDFIVIDRVERPTAGGDQDRPSRFEAVSIRPCVDDTPPAGANGGQRSGQGGFPTISPGRFTIECGTIERLISNAYVLNGDRLENNSPRIGDVSWWKGGPEWIRYDKFTIEASAPGVTDRAVLLGPLLRTLLEERFALKLHRETQEVPMYALTVAKGGPRIQPMPPDGCLPPGDRSGPVDAAAARANADAVTAGTAKPTCSGMTMMGSPGHARWTIGGTTIPNFASILTGSMDHFVVDRTGLNPETAYNIHLEFAPDEHVPGVDKRNPLTDFPPPDAPNIFSALEQQLGLKLEAAKGPQGVLVIDHVEHPKADGGLVVPMRARGPGR